MTPFILLDRVTLWRVFLEGVLINELLEPAVLLVKALVVVEELLVLLFEGFNGCQKLLLGLFEFLDASFELFFL